MGAPVQFRCVSHHKKASFGAKRGYDQSLLTNFDF
jgi:hypothetical protein